jgi:3-methylcrotonyl-CoA carboxylase alpha subunit
VEFLMFKKILIANRGEIACRIVRTCRRLGIGTIAIYSEADATALHVREADEAYCIGPPAARDSYLRGEAIVDLAAAHGAQGIHPGYGFLSENEAFAQACAQAHIIFIGPPVGALRAMGSKSAAKALMAKARVPLVPGYHGDDQDPALLQHEADAIGYPVLIKPSAGGGGKGMQVVERGADFPAALAACQRAGLASFGDAKVLLEKYLERGRHIEIQIFGDNNGQVISLFERDCSAQRRHQKVIEEAPAPKLSEQQREAMGRAACDAARAVAYVGAGTVEFIADAHGAFYFMEMNTRLQVEHPVTEMITGLDLVEWQLRVAAGEALPRNQSEIHRHGHAIEARIYAEEPDKGFLPSIGRLVRFRPPAISEHVRVDAGVDQGDSVTPHYDPMLAKLIVWDETRERAIARMLQALADFQISGVGNNIAFLQRLITHAAFQEGVMDTTLIERDASVLLVPEAPALPEVFYAAALWLVCEEMSAQRAGCAGSTDAHSPWAHADGWRLNGTLIRPLEFREGERTAAMSVQYLPAGYRLNDLPATIESSTADALVFTIGGQRLRADVVRANDELQVFLLGRRYRVAILNKLALSERSVDAHAGLLAPMPGTIISLAVTAGVAVEKGTALLVMEAMKMEHTLRAPGPGKVLAFHCKVGDQVREGAELVNFEARS